jgi:ubiquitin C-terminal hydrolase
MDDGIMLVNEISIALSLMTAYKPDLYKELNTTRNVPNVLLKGVLYKSSNVVRDIIERLTHFIAMNIHPEDSIEKLPLIHLLLAFMDAKIWTKDNTTASEAYYDFLILALEKYSKMEVKGELLANSNGRLKEVLEYLKCYNSFEMVDSVIVDTTLLGLIQLANKLNSLNKFSSIFSIKEAEELVNTLFIGCLFPNEDSTYKCKTEKTREAAYKFVLSLMNYKIELWIHLIDNCIMPLREKVDKPANWGYNPADHRQSVLGYTGIKNLGFICYINSMMQQFFMISPFRNAMLSVCDNKEPSYAANGIDDNLLHQFQRLFVFLLKSTRRDFIPTAFCYSFKEVDGQPTNTAIQHDAHEFLNILFERLEKAFEETPYKYLMQNIFGGKTCSQAICSNCGHVSSVYEDYCTLSLEIKNQNTLEEALEKFISESAVSDYRCSHCEQKVDVARRTVISTLPNILIVHLQRFAFNFDTLMNEKIHTKLEFPNVLDMTHYTEEGFGSKSSSKRIQESPLEDKEHIECKASEMEEFEKELKEGAQHKGEKEKKEFKEKEYYLYKLVGVVMHNGNAESGHYYSYINTDRGPNESDPNFLRTENNKWVEFNDSIIRDFAFSRLEAECFGGSMEDISNGYMDDTSEVAKLIGGRSKSAYLLIYERKYKGMVPLRVEEGKKVPLDAVLLDTLECDSAAVSRASKDIYAKDSKNDIYQLYPFHQLPSNINADLLNVLYSNKL